jgi:dolichyl-phosphate-mannose-protein mannosyltransferase
MRSIPTWLWLSIILIFAFITRLYRVHNPPIYIFDEVYHVITDKLIARNDPRAYEWWHPAIEPKTAIDWLHPPYAKYTQAMSIKAFGENSFGWRFSSVVFGTGVVGLVFWLTKLSFRKDSIALLAAFLTTLDGLLLVQSRIAMNDIHVSFFILLTLIAYFYYRKNKNSRYLLYTGISGGIAMGTKWSGLFIVGTVGLLEGIEILRTLLQKHLNVKKITLRISITAFSLIFLPAVMYFLSYTHMFLQGKTLDHFYKLHQQIWWYQTNLEATHPYQSRPWQWFLDLRPVWFHIDYSNPTKSANIYTFGNPLLFWCGAIAVVSTVAYLVQKKLSKKLTISDTNLLSILLAYGMVWLPWSLSPRIMFFYHYTPAVPFLCIILAYWLWRIWQLKEKDDVEWNKILVVFAVLLIAATFVIWYPQWTAIPVSKSFANTFYFKIPSWK